MEIKRTTNIIVKTQRKVVIHQTNPDEQIFCVNCSEAMLSAQSVAVYQGISTREVYRLIENGKYRFVETEAKIIYVCPNCFDNDSIHLKDKK